jgi:hypothetical protein
MTKPAPWAARAFLALGALLAGCQLFPEPEKPEAEASVIWAFHRFNDSIDIAEVWMDSAGEDDLFTLFFSVNKSRWQKPQGADARLYANGGYATYHDAAGFHIAYIDTGIILRFEPDGTPVKNEFPGVRLPASAVFGRLGSHYLFLAESTLSVLSGATLTPTTYPAFVGAGMRRMSQAAVDGEALTLIEDRGDTLCFFRKTAASVRNFCQKDSLPAPPVLLGTDSIRAWRWDDTAFVYALNFDAGRYEFAVKKWAYTVGVAGLYPLPSSKTFLRYPGDVYYHLKDFEPPAGKP